MMWEVLTGRMHRQDIQMLCGLTSGVANNHLKEILYSAITDEDDRISYNALWAFTHFSKTDREWLYAKRDELIDILLRTNHIGKKRLILTILEQQPVTPDDVRTDYLDYCLSKINSTEPHSIRAFCLKQAFAQCRFYPELMNELTAEMEIMEYSNPSPGLRSAERIIKKKIIRLRKRHENKNLPYL